MYQESKSIKKLIISIVIMMVFITSATYAFLAFQGIANTTATMTGCFEVNYSAQEINASELVSTTDYLEGAKTEVSLSKNESCQIYTEASIYVHTNDTTTAPINTVQALKYKVMLSDVTIAEGVITTTEDSNDTKLATVELTNDAKTYDVYIWVDSELSGGEYNETTYSGYIFAESTQTSTIPNFVKTVMAPAAQSDASIDFSKTSDASSTNGIYLRNGTENDEFPIYYYRGAVDNNLIFANFCWKVVRTTETGGLKLIYNGTPTNGQCNNTGGASQIGTMSFNTNTNLPAYVGYMYGTAYEYGSKDFSSDTTEYVYGNNISYSGGTYTLTNTVTSGSWSSIYNADIKTHHYTCFTTGITCTSVYYIYYTSSSTANYITLKDGKKVENALSEMLDYNTTSSTVKGNSTTEGTLDYWYYTNLAEDYDEYLEDTVWCNDRIIYELNGWDPNGGDPTQNMYFNSYERIRVTYEPSLLCSRDIDKFTVNTNNGNGVLDYPVGLLTADEIMLAGGLGAANSTYYLYTGTAFWGISPCSFTNDSAYGFFVNSSGYLNGNYVNKTYGVRPSISLKSGFSVTSGEGTTTNPYIVDAPPITS